MEVLCVGANMRGAECPSGTCPGTVQTPFATADGASLPSEPGPA